MRALGADRSAFGFFDEPVAQFVEHVARREGLGARAHGQSRDEEEDSRFQAAARGQLAQALEPVLDRKAAQEWIKLNGFLMETRIEYKVIGLFDSFYTGKGQMYFYSTYSDKLYWGDPVYRGSQASLGHMPLSQVPPSGVAQ